MFKRRRPAPDHDKAAPDQGRRSGRGGFALVRWMALGLLCALAAPFAAIVLLRWVPVPTSAFMLARSFEGENPEYRWVPWSRISPALPIAVVASEDQRFPDHKGFDFEAIADAMQANQRRRSNPRGASTISQQVAKNLFLWSGKSMGRKGLEALLTVAIELCWPKRRILEVYLNIAQFGPRTYGAAATAQRYFGVPPAHITPRQAALMAAVLPSPKRYSLSQPSPYVRARAEDIQEQVRHLGGSAYLARMHRAGS